MTRDERLQPWPKTHGVANAITNDLAVAFHGRWPGTPLTSMAFELFLYGFLDGLRIAGIIDTMDDMAWWYGQIADRVSAEQASLTGESDNSQKTKENQAV